MDSNKCSDKVPEGPQALAAEVDALAAEDLEGLADPVLADQTLALRRLLDRLEGQWLQRLATVDGHGRGAAGTAQALCAGELSAAHASVLAHGTLDLPTQTAAKAEPVLVDAARRLDPPRLRQAVAHLRQATDPEGADAQAERRHGGRASGWPPPWRVWSPSGGCWSPRPASSCWPPWSPWPARTAPTMP